MHNVGNQRIMRKRTSSEVKVKMQEFSKRDQWAFAMTKKPRSYDARI